MSKMHLLSLLKYHLLLCICYCSLPLEKNSHHRWCEGSSIKNQGLIMKTLMWKFTDMSNTIH